MAFSKSAERPKKFGAEFFFLSRCRLRFGVEKDCFVAAAFEKKFPNQVLIFFSHLDQKLSSSTSTSIPGLSDLISLMEIEIEAIKMSNR